MVKYFLLQTLFCALIASRETVELKLNQSATEDLRLAVGSCFRIWGYRNEIFQTIGQNKPHLWVWMGDAAYTDNVEKSLINLDAIMDNDYVNERFEDAKNDQYYAEFRKSTPVIGVWDDHDYGCNNCDMTFSKKDYMKQIYLDFIDEPKNSRRRLDENKGIYQDYVIMSRDGIKIHFILLDVRYHYDPISTDRLGDEQFQWLDQIFLKHNDSDVTFIVSGVQVIPDRKSSVEAFEWPSKSKLFDLITKYQKSGVVLLSGDVHFAQFYHTNCKSLTGYNLPEITTSGLSHHDGNFNIFTGDLMNQFTSRFFNTSDIIVDYNFGIISIQRDAQTQEILVDIQVKGLDNKPLLRTQIKPEIDLKFKLESTKHQKMCRIIHSNHQELLKYANVFESIIIRKEFFVFLLLAIVFTIISLIGALVVKFTIGCIKRSSITKN